MQKPGALIIGRGQNSYEYYPTVADIRANTPWEQHGLEGDPGFLSYTPDDHDRNDGSWPDFRFATGPNASGQTAADLPPSLLALLDEFGVDHP